jgi:hypothetical protein
MESDMKYRLRASSLVDTAAYMPLAITGYEREDDRKYIRSIFKKGWGIPDRAAHALLSGMVPYSIGEDNAVEFET